MEPNENQLSSYYLHQQQQSTTSTIAPTTAVTTTSSPTNGLLPNADGSHMVYPHSVPSAVSSQLEPPKRKRGRPRKYGTPEQALAAKKAATLSSHSFSPKDKKDHGLGSASASSSYTGSSKKSQSFALGNAGQGFTPHVITVAAGEDVGQKIMLFMQQSRREMCILSACGSISNVSLRQPATSGGNITYEGRFEIISLSGSYVRTELGGRTGGLSVCLSNSDGEIVGGGVGGPLKAAGPVQVIVGTFFMDTKKDAGVGVKGDASGSKLPSLVGESVSSLGFHQAAAVESSSGNPIRGNDDHQGIGGSHFMFQQRGVHVTPAQPTDWGGRPGYELTGRTGDGHGAHHSPENGDY